jgi:hypothetical protein
MKYVLVDKKDNIVDRVDLHNVGVSGAKTFFIGRKQIPYENFIQLWKVMTETEHKRMKAHDETIKEYEEFGSWLDFEKS